MTGSGRFAALTNYRELKFDRAGSRGTLVRDFLTSDTSVDVYMDQVSKDASEFGGFNLICLDLERGDMGYFSNREDTHVTPLSQRVIYGLSKLRIGEAGGKRLIRVVSCLSALSKTPTKRIL